MCVPRYSIVRFLTILWKKKYFRQYLQYNICVTVGNGINTRVRKNSKSPASCRMILELTNRSLKKKTIENHIFVYLFSEISNGLWWFENWKHISPFWIYRVFIRLLYRQHTIKTSFLKRLYACVSRTHVFDTAIHNNGGSTTNRRGSWGDTPHSATLDFQSANLRNTINY